MDTLWPHEIPLPDTWTVEYAARRRFDLTVYCMGPCRHGRVVDLAKLSASGRSQRRIAELKFRCPRCRAQGQPIVTWWSGGRATWNVLKGEVTGEPPKAEG